MKIETLQFQPSAAAAISDDLAQKLAAAEEAIYRLYQAGHPVYYGYSGGKDSAVITDIGLRAARRFKAEGGNPISVVGTSNTLMENPEIQAHYSSELNKMGRYARRHGLALQTAIIEPTLASTFQVKILTGRGIPSFAGGEGDCTSDLKISGQVRFRKNLFATWTKQGLPPPITVLGVRREESVIRANRMRERGDSAVEPVPNKNGDLVLSPIADWSELDVFEHLGNITNGFVESYSDFKETDRIYAHSAGTSCSIVAMDVHEVRKSPGCGARHGCWGCQKAEDKSLEAMIAHDPRYQYAAGLNKLNKLIRATRYDWSLRHWVGRTIQGGYIEVKPDTYHPKFIRDLTRYMLQLDYDEEVRARRAGGPPKFRILPLEMMIAIDALQSLNGLAKPFQVWADHRDIRQRKVRYDIPDVPTTPPQPLPPTRYLHVGTAWDDGLGSNWHGLRCDFLEGIVGETGCLPPLRELKDGKKVWDVHHEQQFGIDQEAAMMIEDFELDNLLEYHDRGFGQSTTGFAYKWYAQFGVLTLSHAQLAKHDEVLRRTAYKDSLGLTLDYSVEDVLAHTVAFEDLPAAAQLAWSAPKKPKKEKKGKKRKDETDEVSFDPCHMAAEPAPPAAPPETGAQGRQIRPECDEHVADDLDLIEEEEQLRLPL